MQGIQLITTELFAEVEAKAAASPRLRMNHNFHSGPEDNPHRMLNVLLRGTYVRPHRHVTPPKSEAFLPLTGQVGIVCFDDDGAVTGTYLLDAAGPVDDAVAPDDVAQGGDITVGCGDGICTPREGVHPALHGWRPELPQLHDRLSIRYGSFPQFEGVKEFRI